MSIREFDFQKQRVRVRTTSCADAHVACDFGHHAILLDVKANFAKRGTPIQSQNSHGSSLIVVLEKSSAGQQHADTAHPLALPRAPQAATQSRRSPSVAAFRRRATQHSRRQSQSHDDCPTCPPEGYCFRGSAINSSMYFIAASQPASPSLKKRWPL